MTLNRIYFLWHSIWTFYHDNQLDIFYHDKHYVLFAMTPNIVFILWEYIKVVLHNVLQNSNQIYSLHYNNLFVKI